MTPEITWPEALKEDRHQRGMTQFQYAEWLGISRERYARIESGKARNFSINSVWKFMQARVRIEAMVACSHSSDHRHLVVRRNRDERL